MSWLGFIIAPFFTIVGYLIKLYSDQRAATIERIYADKREHYRTLLLSLKSISEGETNHIELLWFEYSFLWLHASDSVVKSANVLVAQIKMGELTSAVLTPLIGDLLLEMRRDMGFRKTELLQSDFKGK